MNPWRQRPALFGRLSVLCDSLLQRIREQLARPEGRFLWDRIAWLVWIGLPIYVGARAGQRRSIERLR